jgi:NADH:ubiquinone oxidoreductase subunit 2 (subunit N)
MSEQEPKSLSKEQASKYIATTLRAAGNDAFVLSVVFALWGVMNVMSGQGLMIALGGFQIFLSCLYVQTGMARRELAKAFDTQE